MRLLYSIALATCPWLLLASAGTQDSAKDTAALLASLMDQSTVFAARLNLRSLDGPGLLRLAESLGWTHDQKATAAVKADLAPWNSWREELLTAGAIEVYLLAGTSLGRAGNAGSGPPVDFLLVLRLEAAADANKVLKLLQPRLDSHLFKEHVIKGSLLILGAKNVTVRLEGRSRPAAEVAPALEAHALAAVQVMLLPSPDLRRAVTELLPQLPPELGGGPSRVLTDGCHWASMGLFLDQPRAELAVQAASPEAARNLATWLKNCISQLARDPRLTKMLPSLPATQDSLIPSADRSQLRLTLSTRTPALWQLLKEMEQRIVATSASQQSGQQQRQILLAMHNYHNDYGTLPPQAIKDQAGTPLLSWRVALLPYLGQDALYKEFKLDEAWDSPHNKKLLARIPAVYQRPRMPASPVAAILAAFSVGTPSADPMEGHRTPYQVPLVAGSVFSETKPLSLVRLAAADGTSNTVVLVEVVEEHAVPWTKPSDWLVNEKLGVGDLHFWANGRSYVTFGDGSVRSVKRTAPFNALKALLGWRDGNNVDLDPVLGADD